MGYIPDDRQSICNKDECERAEMLYRRVLSPAGCSTQCPTRRERQTSTLLKLNDFDAPRALSGFDSLDFPRCFYINNRDVI